ncbi:MAG: 50S ribosomal protein L32 [Candidatus Wallbacteria bacterium]|nr:50S ribosomal protein L32 [Candidatus Wallbacteria bacterium]
MGVPKRRTPASRKGMRRSHHALPEPKHIGTCSNPDCRQPVASHQICPECGYYKGKQVVKTAAK